MLRSADLTGRLEQRVEQMRNYIQRARALLRHLQVSGTPPLTSTALLAPGARLAGSTFLLRETFTQPKAQPGPPPGCS